MPQILKKDKGVIVTLESGLVRKTVIGENHSGFRKAVCPEEMVDREIRALHMLEGIAGVQRFVRRESTDTFYTEYMEGTSLLCSEKNLNKIYFDELSKMARTCTANGVYRLGQNRRDFIVQPNGMPGIIDFGNIIFDNDPYAELPGALAMSQLYSVLRLWDLRRRYTHQNGHRS